MGSLCKHSNVWWRGEERVFIIYFLSNKNIECYLIGVHVIIFYTVERMKKTKKKRNLKNATYNGITLFAAETE